jgi:succinyl-CoA synthetase beta subunit
MGGIMKLFEYEAKNIFKDFGIPVPRGLIAKCSSDVISIIEKVGLPAVIKAQVPASGRGKAGGVKLVNGLEEAIAETEKIMGMTIKGCQINSVLIEGKVDIKAEYYLGITIDQIFGKPLVMFSTEGGIEVEAIVKEKPEKLVSKKVNISRGFFPFEARELCKSLGLKGPILLKVSDILYRLYNIFTRYDAITVEINPLAITGNNEVCAIGATMEIDDNALFRQPDVKLDIDVRFDDEIKKDAVRRGLSYVKLEGDIGIIGSGAGLTMATIDIIKDFGGKPANFLETGGGITKELMAGAVELMLKDKRLKALFINLYGGINPMPSAAEGIVEAYERLKPKIPIFVKLLGNQQEEAWDILEKAGIPVIKEIQTERAVEKMLASLGA